MICCMIYFSYYFYDSFCKRPRTRGKKLKRNTLRLKFVKKKKNRSLALLLSVSVAVTL